MTGKAVARRAARTPWMVLAAVTAVTVGFSGTGCEAGSGGEADAAVMTGTLSAEAGFDDATVDALVEALEDERRAIGFYTNVMERFGPRRPFVDIIRAERSHESAIISLLERHGHEVPSMSEIDLPAVPATFTEACASAAQAEVDNVAMYDRLLGEISHPATRAVMERLRRASQERHLPAFRRHAGRGGA